MAVNQVYFDEFIKLNKKGLKQEAMENIDKFIKSFENDNERETWTKEYLKIMKITKDGTITNEGIRKVYGEIMYSVLLNGYKNKDSFLTLWLTKLVFNFRNTPKIDGESRSYFRDLKEIGAPIKNEDQVYMDLYKMDPQNPEVQEYYLKYRITNIKGTIYNMPGIYDNWKNSYATMTVEECNAELEDVKILQKLDKKKEFTELLKGYERNLNKYLKRINYSNENLWNEDDDDEFKEEIRKKQNKKK